MNKLKEWLIRKLCSDKSELIKIKSLNASLLVKNNELNKKVYLVDKELKKIKEDNAMLLKGYEEILDKLTNKEGVSNGYKDSEKS